MPLMPNVFTRTLASIGDKNEGSVGPYLSALTAMSMSLYSLGCIL